MLLSPLGAECTVQFLDSAPEQERCAFVRQTERFANAKSNQNFRSRRRFVPTITSVFSYWICKSTSVQSHIYIVPTSALQEVTLCWMIKWPYLVLQISCFYWIHECSLNQTTKKKNNNVNVSFGSSFLKIACFCYSNTYRKCRHEDIHVHLSQPKKKDF